MEISVVIPTYNRSERLHRLIASIYNSIGSYADIEIIVVNDGGSKVSLEICKRYKDIIYFSIKKGGPAKARNFGARNSSKQTLLFVDDDCVLDDCFFENLTKLSFDKKLAYYPRILPYTKSRRNFITRYQNSRNIAGKIWENSRNAILCVPSAAYIIARNTFFEAGGFSESFQYPGGEDDFFTQALISIGVDFRQACNCIAYHDYSSNLMGLLKKNYRYGFGHVINCHKRGIDFSSYDIRFTTYTSLALGFVLYARHRPEKEGIPIHIAPIRLAELFSLKLGNIGAIRRLSRKNYT